MTQQSSATPQTISADESIFQFHIAPLAGHVQQLLASLHGLNEAVKLLHLSLKAQAAQTDDADAVEVYRLALQEVYGITIYGDVAANFEALQNYQEALDLFAQFLETTYFPDGTLMVDKYAFFQEVMGNMTIRRTKDRHEASGEKGFGFSTGHEIWDMFTVNGQDRQSQMTTNNFIHELFHSFNTFSGMGGQRPGSLFARADIVSVLLNNITEESFDGKV